MKYIVDTVNRTITILEKISSKEIQELLTTYVDYEIKTKQEEVIYKDYPWTNPNSKG